MMSKDPRMVGRGVTPIVVVVLACCLLGLMHVLSKPGTTLFQRLLGASFGLATIGAAWRYWHYGLFHRLPFPEYALLQAYLYFGMPTITGSLLRGPQAPPDAVTMALVACIVFMGCALCTAAVGSKLGRLARPNLGRVLPRTLAPGIRFVLPFWIAVVVLSNTGALFTLPLSIRFAASVMAKSSGLLVFFAFAAEHPDDTKAMRRVVLTAGLLAGSGLLSGMLEQVLQPLLLAATLMLMQKRRIPVAWVAGALLIFVVLNPAKHHFREERNWAHDKEHSEDTADTLLTGPGEAMDAWWDALRATWEEDAVAPRRTSGSLDRLNYLSGVARTVDWAGRRVPFDRGARWDVIAESYVPRILHPGKANITREFNDRYNYLFGIQSARSTRTTTVALPLVSDGYWNFGWLGVVGVGGFAGVFWGFFTNLWDPKHWGLSSIAMWFFPTCSIVTSFHGYAAGIVLTAIGYALTMWLLYVASLALSSSRDLAPSHAGRGKSLG